MGKLSLEDFQNGKHNKPVNFTYSHYYITRSYNTAKYATIIECNEDKQLKQLNARKQSCWKLEMQT